MEYVYKKFYVIYEEEGAGGVSYIVSNEEECIREDMRDIIEAGLEIIASNVNLEG